jgi:TolB-like protein/Flp pilus assembly protein TadD
MPHVEGETLRERLEREGQLPIDQALSIAAEVADGLAYAHEHSVVHRDIKPGNILLSAGHARIADFGVARAISEAGGEKVTATGMAVGTPAYMSPEQASGDEVDERSDLYALGCVLYEMLAGEPPLTGSTAQSTAAKRLTDRPTPLGAMRRTVPGKLESLVERTLATSAADRPATARKLAEDLAEVRSSPEPAARMSPAARWLVPAIGLAVIVIAVAVWRQAGITPGSADADLRSIAVLPFVNMSDDASNEYFSDGISEELLNLLAKIPELRVAARTSSFSFRGENLAIPEIAERLKVAHVLEGSVRKAGNEVRITAQLVRADDGFHMWSDTWDRTLDDIFAIQDEIAADVVAQLKVTLLGAAPTVEQTHPEAYALFLQARQLGRHIESREQSNTLYERALAIDPDYAAAWAGLAHNYASQANYDELPADEGYPLAREAANRALAINPEYAEAYATLGKIAVGYDFDLAAAARHLERALELEPTNPNIIRDAAYLASRLGRFDEAFALFEYAVARDPVNPDHYAHMAWASLFAGRLDEAIASARTFETLSPGLKWVQYVIGSALLLKGEPEAALAAMQQESDEPFRLTGLALAYYALGQAAESDAALSELIDKYEQEWPYDVASALAFRGEADRAFEWLDKAVRYNALGLWNIAIDILFANLHDDPRWLPFLESIGMSPEQLAAIEFEVQLPQ